MVGFFMMHQGCPVIHFTPSAASDWITTGPNSPDVYNPDLSGGFAGLIGLKAILLWV
jgi:hypothetical protein